MQFTKNVPATEELRSFLARTFDRNDVPHYRFLREYWIETGHIDRLISVFQRLAPLLKPSDSLLDVGSLGEWPFLLWRYLGLTRLYACSLEGGYIAYGQGSLKQFDEPDKEFELSIYKINIENQPLPFEDKSLDVITCFETLEHLRYDPIFATQEFNRVLKHKGLLILTTPNINSYDGILRMIEYKTPCIFSRYLPDRQGIGHCKEYSVNEIKEFLRNCGFKIDVLETFDSVPPLDLKPEFISECEDLKNVLTKKGWREELARQIILVVAKRVAGVTNRYYFPLYTITEPCRETLWFPESSNEGLVEEPGSETLLLKTAPRSQSLARARYRELTGEGDFLLHLTYVLAHFPTPPVDRIEAAVFLSSADWQECYAIGRQLFADGYNVYFLWERNGSRTDVPTTHLTGQIRVRRVGTTLYADYRDPQASQWYPIGNCPVTRSPLSVSLRAYNSDSQTEVEVYFSDFTLAVF